MICGMDEDLTSSESTGLHGELQERLRFETQPGKACRIGFSGNPQIIPD